MHQYPVNLRIRGIFSDEIEVRNTIAVAELLLSACHTK